MNVEHATSLEVVKISFKNNLLIVKGVVKRIEREITATALLPENGND